MSVNLSEKVELRCRIPLTITTSRLKNECLVAKIVDWKGFAALASDTSHKDGVILSLGVQGAAFLREEAGAGR